MPRKSDIHIPGAGPSNSGDNKESSSGVSIEDNTLPKSIITRLAKGVLPPNTIIHKDAQLALTKGATVFINHLCSIANEIATKNNRKTFMPKDVLEAIEELEYSEFSPRLNAELKRYEEIQSEKRAAQKKAAQSKADNAATAGTTGSGDHASKTTPAHATDDGDAPPSKKRKANGKSIPTSAGKSKKPESDGEDEDDDDDDGEDDADDAIDDDDDVGADDEQDVDEEDDETKKIDAGDVVQDVDEAEPSDDEALDNGEESDSGR